MNQRQKLAIAATVKRYEKNLFEKEDYSKSLKQRLYVNDKEIEEIKTVISELKQSLNEDEILHLYSILPNADD